MVWMSDLCLMRKNSGAVRQCIEYKLEIDVDAYENT